MNFIIDMEFGQDILVSDSVRDYAKLNIKCGSVTFPTLSLQTQ
jgi:hypothetical protein